MTYILLKMLKIFLSLYKTSRGYSSIPTPCRFFHILIILWDLVCYWKMSQWMKEKRDEIGLRVIRKIINIHETMSGGVFRWTRGANFDNLHEEILESSDSTQQAVISRWIGEGIRMRRCWGFSLGVALHHRMAAAAAGGVQACQDLSLSRGCASRLCF